jgi:hypothetical protein
MIELDGATGEGGGQILRSALSLAMVTGTPFRIRQIRARRSKPLGEGLLDVVSMSEREVAPILPVPPLELYTPPPNPVHETNKIARQLLEYQKREAVGSYRTVSGRDPIHE